MYEYTVIFTHFENGEAHDNMTFRLKCPYKINKGDQISFYDRTLGEFKKLTANLFEHLFTPEGKHTETVIFAS